MTAKSNDYKWITDEMFDNKLKEIMNRDKASTLLVIEGVYETVKEYFNNDILTELENEKEA